MNKNYISGCLFSCFVLLAFSVFLGGCGYVGQSILPSYIKKIHVALFANKSFRPDLPEKILSTVTKEFIADGRLMASEENEADAILYGEITRYDLQPLSYSEQMRVDEYKVRIIVSIWLKDSRKGAVLWQEDHIEVFTTVSSTMGGLEVEVESEAIKDVVEKLARKVIRRVIDGWT